MGNYRALPGEDAAMLSMHLLCSTMQALDAMPFPQPNPAPPSELKLPLGTETVLRAASSARISSSFAAADSCTQQSQTVQFGRKGTGMHGVAPSF